MPTPTMRSTSEPATGGSEIPREDDPARRKLLDKLKCVFGGHSWRIDMDPRRSGDAKLCIRCRRVEEC